MVLRKFCALVGLANKFLVCLYGDYQSKYNRTQCKFIIADKLSIGTFISASNICN